MVYLARVLALCVDTCNSQRTIWVYLTLGLNRCDWSYTCDKSVSSCTRVTGTVWLMVDPPARGILGTCVRPTHWTTSLAYEVTSLVLATIIVCSALYIDTGNQRIPLQPCGADAPCLVELHQALGTSATGALSIQTRIQTILIDTGTVNRTVVIHSTLRSVALSVRVSAISFRTRTHGMMCPGGAPCLWSTGIVNDARIDASFIDTCLVLWAFGVRCAFRTWLNGITIGKWISREPRRAVASYTVLTNITHRIRCAWIRDDAWIYTISVPADFSVSAFAIGFTAGLRSWWEVTGYISIPYITRNAHANHGSLWQSILYGALSILTTGCQRGARVATNFIQTSKSTRTISIYCAFWLWFRYWETPGVVWIPLVSFITLAPCSVTPHNTICIHGTIARIHAFLIPTCKNLGAFLVHHTLGLCASCVGVSSVGGWTVAPCSVVARLAECFNTTLGQPG